MIDEYQASHFIFHHLVNFETHLDFEKNEMGKKYCIVPHD